MGWQLWLLARQGPYQRPQLRWKTKNISSGATLDHKSSKSGQTNSSILSRSWVINDWLRGSPAAARLVAGCWLGPRRTRKRTARSRENTDSSRHGEEEQSPDNEAKCPACDHWLFRAYHRRSYLWIKHRYLLVDILHINSKFFLWCIMDHVVEATTTTTLLLLSSVPSSTAWCPLSAEFNIFLFPPNTKAAANVINKMVYIRYLWFPIQTQSITAYGLDYTKYWCLAQIHILGHCCHPQQHSGSP